MNIVKFLIKKSFRVINKLLNTIYFLLLNQNERLLINGYMVLYGKHVKHRNFGDDLNYYMLLELTGKKIINYNDIYIHKAIHYCCIGSILDSLANSRSIIWGAGFILDETTIKENPLKVCAVRGKLSRKRLVSLGVDCPPIYGDPVLLLPLVYTPVNRKRKFVLGMIPHVDDLDNPMIFDLASKYKDVKIIKLNKYKHWHNIIDEINQCEYIISSSLHGLIVADAYGIPNTWVEFSEKTLWQRFKFQDYYSSVRDIIPEAVRITSEISIEDILEYRKYWIPINIDMNLLLSVCPFKHCLRI